MIIDKFNLLSDEILKDSRLAICDTCDKKTMKLGERLCTECNCLLKFKTQLKKATCPLAKW